MSYQSDYSGAQVDEAVGKALNPDATPTEGSANLVQSGGVASAVSAVMNSVSRRNLLDNWYFVGGGSQQGGGQFPINQRGKTVYTAGYCIDRWHNEGLSGSSTELVSGGLKLTNTTSQRARISQAFESSLISFLTGKYCTISAIVDGVLYSAIKPMFANNSSVSVGPLDVFSPTGSNSLIIQLTASNPARTATISAVKLELGSVSTLANDAPPNFAEELAKCQRYYWNSGFTSSAVGIFFGLSNAAGNNFSVYVPTPVTMRNVTPTITATVAWVRGEGAPITGYSLNTINATIVSGYVATISIDKTSGFSALKMYAVAFSELNVSCDL